jgi:hypothetical protein
MSKGIPIHEYYKYPKSEIVAANFGDCFHLIKTKTFVRARAKHAFPNLSDQSNHFYFRAYLYHESEEILTEMTKK